MNTHRNNLLSAMQLCSVLLLTFFIEASAQAQMSAAVPGSDNRSEATRTLALMPRFNLSLAPVSFRLLNRDFRYQLTPIGAPAQGLYVAEEINQNRFKIAGGVPGGKVSWQVTGVRSDAVMRQHPFKVEETKPDRERGTYLSPEAFGQPEEKSSEWTRNPEMMRQIKETREKALKAKRD
jgi:hypothetical protein